MGKKVAYDGRGYKDPSAHVEGEESSLGGTPGSQGQQPDRGGADIEFDTHEALMVILHLSNTLPIAGRRTHIDAEVSRHGRGNCPRWLPKRVVGETVFLVIAAAGSPALAVEITVEDNADLAEHPRFREGVLDPGVTGFAGPGIIVLAQRAIDAAAQGFGVTCRGGQPGSGTQSRH